MQVTHSLLSNNKQWFSVNVSTITSVTVLMAEGNVAIGLQQVKSIVCWYAEYVTLRRRRRRRKTTSAALIQMKTPERSHTSRVSQIV